MRCTVCRGSKEVLGMGATIVKCKACDGVGSVVDKDKIVQAVDDIEDKLEKKEKVRRGNSKRK